MKTTGIPEPTLVRLTIYARCLSDMIKENDAVVSSEELAHRAGVNAAQVRKDLSYLGSFGRRGVGYDVRHLADRIAVAMGLTKERSFIIVGAGRLGSALLGYEGFLGKGFKAVAAFDADPKKVGTETGGVLIRPMEEMQTYLEANGVEIGIITVPAAYAQKTADTLIKAGVKAILNFAPLIIKVPARIQYRQVELSSEMEVLAHYLSSQGD
jgi:redox-sensing transcriptional repressor